MKNFTLANGLRIIVIPRKTKVATLNITVKTGSNSDPPGKQGISHFIEHMLFEGTTSRTALDISRQIESLGGDIGGYTSNERTCYYIKCLSKHIKTAADILADIIANPSCDEKSTEKERKVVLSEISMRQDEPRFYQWETFLKNLFAGYPCQNSIVGTKASVISITRNDLFDYFNRNYSPKNMILAYSGPDNDIIKLLKEKFEKLKDYSVNLAPISNVTSTESGSLQKKKIIKIKRKINQAYFVLGYRTVPLNHKDSPVLDVIRAVLGKGLSGRIVEEIRAKRGLAYDVGAVHESGADYGFFAVYFSTEESNLKLAEELAKKELQKIPEISLQEIEDAKNFIEGDFLISIDDPQKHAEAASFFEQCGLGTDVMEHIRKIRAVRKKDIIRVANEYFGSNYTCCMILPQKNDPSKK